MNDGDIPISDFKLFNRSMVQKPHGTSTKPDPVV